ncbi:MAG: AbiV family abortive infection protein [Patescibacteria group bacterium]
MKNSAPWSIKKLGNTTKACIKNGNRLLEDAKYLFDFGSYASAYALSKLAQEEFAKSFILKLVEAGSLKWTMEVRKSLKHHVSKQLMGIILEYLNPSTEEFFKMLKDNTLFKKPTKVSDAINIYIHEVLRRWESQNWDWAEDPRYDEEAKSVYRGKEEKLKQDAIYIKISKDGQAINFPTKFEQVDAEEEIEKAGRYGQFLNLKGDLRYKEIAEIFRALKY